MNYEVVCDDCSGSSIVTIEKMGFNEIINWRKIGKIISARKRLDDHWGWQCYCGNNSLMTQQEINIIDNPAQPESQEIAQIVKNLIPETKTGFQMRPI